MSRMVNSFYFFFFLFFFFFFFKFSRKISWLHRAVQNWCGLNHIAPIPRKLPKPRLSASRGFAVDGWFNSIAFAAYINRSHLMVYRDVNLILYLGLRPLQRATYFRADGSFCMLVCCCFPCLFYFVFDFFVRWCCCLFVCLFVLRFGNSASSSRWSQSINLHNIHFQKQYRPTPQKAIKKINIHQMIDERDPLVSFIFRRLSPCR